jgi:ATP-dependent RNA helicase DDX55/SPB4
MASSLLFSSLRPPLSAASLAAVESFSFTRMTPVQGATIPLFMTNKDVCVEATTGSGKTLAFVLPIYEILNRRTEKLKKHQVGALIIAPTRYSSNSIFVSTYPLYFVVY